MGSTPISATRQIQKHGIVLVMGTVRQAKLAKAVVTNLQAAEPLNKQELVASVGYSELSADHKATEILNSKGVRDALRELGFDSDNAKRVVAEILEHGEDDNVRLKAAQEVFKINGDYAPTKTANLNAHLQLSTDPSDVDLDLLVKEAESKLKEAKTNG